MKKLNYAIVIFDKKGQIVGKTAVENKPTWESSRNEVDKVMGNKNWLNYKVFDVNSGKAIYDLEMK